jgi:hypothetical protein
VQASSGQENDTFFRKTGERHFFLLEEQMVNQPPVIAVFYRRNSISGEMSSQRRGDPGVMSSPGRRSG